MNIKTKIGILALVVVAIIWACSACQHTPVATIFPLAQGCGASATALGTHLVTGMAWTNPTDGTFASGNPYLAIPEGGGWMEYMVDASISCQTNQPNVIMMTWTCKTNPPVYQFIQLPANCYGAKFAITFDCSNCSFMLGAQQGFSCNIQRPYKK